MTATLINGPKDGVIIRHPPQRAMEMGKLFTEVHASDRIDAVYFEPGTESKAEYQLINYQGGDPIFYFVGYT